ncbi:MAG: hypothetical protein M4579_006334 [Chaenotheca gracillima]|nr:MAG: hypothetical protein M4579_006334 [Chaenotheca gracillima]
MSRKSQSQNQKGGGKKASAGSGAGGADEEREDVLQAVILVDSFETRFHPFTLERPRCLLPLANTPLIEYTLEFLANAGVDKIFLYCGAHTDQVEDYISASKWKGKVEVLKNAARSIGDAMRDLDHRDILSGDFLIVTGDVVSNVPLEVPLAEHRARRATDKNAIMTMILREAGRDHRAKDQADPPVFVIDPTKNRCLHYEEHPQRRRKDDDESKYIEIDPELLPSHSEIDIRSDLIDCAIDICTPDVLALWSDSFDYEVPRKQFLYGVLKDYELNGKTIHTHIVDDHYAARVRNLSAYDAISKDIISKWTYPLCPDSNLLQGQSYRFRRGNTYMENGVVLARSCVVKRQTVIGQGTSIGDGSIISGSVIGRRCQIGKNVRIEGAYIWDDAAIGDGSEVRQAIVANEAFVGPRCFLEPGALVSYGVRISEGTKVSGSRRITRSHSSKDGAPLARKPLADEIVVGTGGEGYDFVDSDEDEEDEEYRASSGLIYNMSHLSLSASSISTLGSSSEEDESDSGAFAHTRRPSDRGSFATTASDDGDFYHDASTSIFGALQRDESPDIIQLELQGLRLSTNADYHQVRHAIVTAYMRRIHQLIEPSSSDPTAGAGLGTSEAVTQTLRKYHVIFEKIVFDRKGAGSAQKPDQVDLLLLLQRDLTTRSRGESILLFVVKELYELDVFEEESVNLWWSDERSTKDDDMKRVRRQTKQFVDWLAEAEEDDSDDDDDDESE